MLIHLVLFENSFQKFLSLVLIFVLAKRTLLCCSIDHGPPKALYIYGLMDDVSNQDFSLFVSDLWILWIEGDWCFDYLHTTVPLWLQYEIQSVFLNDQVPDMVVWGDSPNSTYYAKSAYGRHTKARITTSYTMGRGSWVCTLKLLENIKHFLWITNHQCLPTNIVSY